MGWSALVVLAAAQAAPVSLNWYLHFECRGCSTVVLEFESGVTIEAPPKRTFHWTYYWDQTKTPELGTGEVFVTMAQTIYRVTLQPSGVEVWISPYGIAFHRLPPLPVWHGKEVAPEEWASAYAAWLDSHDFVAEDAAQALGQLQYRRQVHCSVTISQKLASAAQEIRSVLP